MYLLTKSAAGGLNLKIMFFLFHELKRNWFNILCSEGQDANRLILDICEDHLLIAAHCELAYIVHILLP
jgi:hypothetical protein